MVREMKHTEIGDIPVDWELQTFEETFRVLSNNTLSRENLNNRGGAVRNIHYGDILTKFPEVLDCSKEEIPYINDLSLLTSSTQLLQDGDIVIADTAEDETVGKVIEVQNLGEEKLVAGLHTIPCRVKKGDFAPGWLGYYMNSQLFHSQILPYVTGIKVSSISKSAIAETLILVPPKGEQKMIIAILNDIERELHYGNKLVKKKEAIRQGMYQSLVTGRLRLNGYYKKWKYKTIGSMTTVSSGGTPSTINPEYWGGNIPWMNSGELNLKIVNNVEGRITETGLSNSSTHWIPAYCTLIGLAGQGKTRGTAAYNTIKLCTNQSIAAIYPNEKEFDAKFLYYLMNTQYEQLRELSSGGGGRGGLTKKLIEDFLVYMPEDISEQTAIAEILTDIDEEIRCLKETLQKNNNLKKGIVSELVERKRQLV